MTVTGVATDGGQQEDWVTGEEVVITHITGNLGGEEFTAHLNSTLRPGVRLRYSMNFTSHLQQSLRGFFAVKYEDEGVER